MRTKLFCQLRICAASLQKSRENFIYENLSTIKTTLLFSSTSIRHISHEIVNLPIFLLVASYSSSAQSFSLQNRKVSSYGFSCRMTSVILPYWITTSNTILAQRLPEFDFMISPSRCRDRVLALPAAS